jgi:hypothetical protein
MQIRPVADPEMVEQIHTCVQTPELRSLLLQIVQDQRISDNAREQLKAYLNSFRPGMTRSRVLGQVNHPLNRC